MPAEDGDPTAADAASGGDPTGVPADHDPTSESADGDPAGESADPDPAEESVATDAAPADESADADPSDEPVAAAGPAEPSTGPVGDGRRREVVVPERLYRVVTVFSTLIAVLSFVLGFAALDAATTILGNPPASLVVRLLGAVGVSRAALAPYHGALALLVALVGLGLIAGSAAFYAYGTRFRAPGMGKPKDESDEPTDDG